MENKNLRHVAIIQNESEAEALRELNEAVDEHELKIINYSKEHVSVEDFVDKVWRIEIFFEGPNVFDYDFSGSQSASLRNSDANRSRSR